MPQSQARARDTASKAMTPADANALRTRRSNQHRARADGAKDAEYIRRKIRAGALIGRLNRAARGEIELSKIQVEATKILLDKAMPSLQAIEQTQVNPWDQMSEDEMVEQVRALIAAHPQLIKLFAPGPTPVEPAEAQSEPGNELESVVSEQQTQRSMG